MRYPIAAAALLASLALAERPASAQEMNVSVRSDHEVRTCADLQVTFDGRPAVTAVDQLTAPATQRLTVHAARSGGVYVYGGSRSDFAISACKAAAPSRGASALDQVRVGVRGGTLEASGPSGDGWIVYFIVDAPTKADIDLDATNGPISIARMAGTTTARAQNGPIKLLDVSGRATASTQNGPIDYEGGSGTIELTAQNGPVAVRLAGGKWATGTLTASAQNGPVKLDAPRGFGSGVRVRSSQHSPWNCQGCGDQRRTWDDNSRSVEFGSGPVAVTLSTVNGPVAVDLTR
jgi:hypothetical protein